jgi:hypothetical protein
MDNPQATAQHPLAESSSSAEPTGTDARDN